MPTTIFSLSSFKTILHSPNSHWSSWHPRDKSGIMLGPMNAAHLPDSHNGSPKFSKDECSLNPAPDIEPSFSHRKACFL